MARVDAFLYEKARNDANKFYLYPLQQGRIGRINRVFYSKALEGACNSDDKDPLIGPTGGV